MYRVELKGGYIPNSFFNHSFSFLMYRVELKARNTQSGQGHKTLVPNVPCGVERKTFLFLLLNFLFVPNVPCGVESIYSLGFSRKTLRFLMYRVELKVVSGFSRHSGVLTGQFLMYRVELKVLFEFSKGLQRIKFLMYRVELKGNTDPCFATRTATLGVPNVPCGVESSSFVGTTFKDLNVPNVPCGVESPEEERIVGVERPVPNVPCGVESREQALQACKQISVPNVPCGVESYPGVMELPVFKSVPNVPCGVESYSWHWALHRPLTGFLMYRVELKALPEEEELARYLGFLMYRVELKVLFHLLCKL